MFIFGKMFDLISIIFDTFLVFSIFKINPEQKSECTSFPYFAKKNQCQTYCGFKILMKIDVR